MSGKTALILGATGATGKHLLRQLLASPEYTRVGEFGRRVTAAKDLPADHSKLEQHSLDFDKLSDTDDQGLKAGKWDVVFITLGTTRAKAGSAEAFEKIDREYVLAAARAAKVEDPTHSQRLVYCSSQGANANSSFLYPKSKGLTEIGLAKLGYSDTIIFRPAFLAEADREGAGGAEKFITPIINGLSSINFIGARMQMPVPLLGKAMAKAGLTGSAALPPGVTSSKEGEAGAEFTVIGNQAALKLADSV